MEQRGVDGGGGGGVDGGGGGAVVRELLRGLPSRCS